MSVTGMKLKNFGSLSFSIPWKYNYKNSLFLLFAIPFSINRKGKNSSSYYSKIMIFRRFISSFLMLQPFLPRGRLQVCHLIVASRNLLVLAFLRVILSRKRNRIRHFPEGIWTPILRTSSNKIFRHKKKILSKGRIFSSFTVIFSPRCFMKKLEWN